jgi:hypothetical protein
VSPIIAIAPKISPRISVCDQTGLAEGALNWGRKASRNNVVLRDRQVSRPGSRRYVYDAC